MTNYSDHDLRAVLAIAAGDGGVRALARRLDRDDRLVRGWFADPPRTRPGRSAWGQLLEEAAAEIVRHLRAVEAIGGRVEAVILPDMPPEGWSQETYAELARRTRDLAATVGITTRAPSPPAAP